MPPRHRLAIAAHFRGGVSVEDLASSFGLSVARTRNIITEAKDMFRNRVCGGPDKSRPSRRLGTSRGK
jgi:DNA-directed RNA polymerase specialized sigma24 family protein